MSNWRRKLIPSCPECNEPGGFAAHSSCNGELYINIKNGRVKCSTCHKEWSVENTAHVCDACGAEFTGGEIWERVSQEIADLQDMAWARSVKIRKGVINKTIIKHGNSFKLRKLSHYL